MRVRERGNVVLTFEELQEWSSCTTMVLRTYWTSWYSVYLELINV